MRLDHQPLVQAVSAAPVRVVMAVACTMASQSLFPSLGRQVQKQKTPDY